MSNNVPHVAHNSGNMEWYTPAEYIEAARSVMGSIDLDPASCAIANLTVMAARYYTAETDGLSQPWSGNVWLNPPYAIKLIRPFVKKLIHHYLAGEVEQAIVLVNNATETDWFFNLAGAVFPTGRIHFLTASGQKGSPLQGQAILYLGERPYLFLHEFSRFGWGAEIFKS